MANPQSTVDERVPESLELRRVSYRPDLDVVLATGDLDRHTAPLLNRELSTAQPRVLVCDLSGVAVLDDGGLAVLLDAADTAREAGRRFGVVADADIATDMARLSGSAARLDAFTSLSDAIRELPTG
jgi:anti-anti-sigma factor